MATTLKSDKFESNMRANTFRGGRNVDVLLQKLGDKWYAFVQIIGEEVNYSAQRSLAVSHQLQNVYYSKINPKIL